MINPKDHPAGTFVTLIDGGGCDSVHAYQMREGTQYEIEYWDGCCVCVKVGAFGPTLHRDRFAPSSREYPPIDDARAAASQQTAITSGAAYPFVR